MVNRLRLLLTNSFNVIQHLSVSKKLDTHTHSTYIPALYFNSPLIHVQLDRHCLHSSLFPIYTHTHTLWQCTSCLRHPFAQLTHELMSLIFFHTHSSTFLLVSLFFCAAHM